MNIEKLTMAYGIHEIFNEVNIHINEFAKVGIIGVNGAGKTTLFKIIMGQISPNDGRIAYKKNTRIGYLPQVIKDEVSDMDINVLDFLLEGRPIKKLEKELEDIYILLSNEKDNSKINNLAKKINNIQNELDYYEQYKEENILLKIISGMKISDELLDLKLKDLSGGQKSIIAFAKLLYSKPEILLLDEPTNHLDKESRNFVINYLKNVKATVLVISHDIEFLNQITDTTLYINKITHKMEIFNGNYQKYLKIKEEKEKTLIRISEKQKVEEEKLKRIIAKYIRANEKKAKIAKDRQKKLARLEKEKVVIEKKDKITSMKLEINYPSEQIPLKINDLTFGYNEYNLINNLSFELTRGEKSLIVGVNGVGKSTLLKLIIGSLLPKKGEIILGKKTNIGYYAQEHELLDNEKTIMDNFSDTNLLPNQIRSLLGNFLFNGDDVYKKVEVLSPGERSRVALAKLAVKKANFLILDEPTNHLDPNTRKIIGDTFKTYPGTMLIVSHNIEFVDNLDIDRILILPEGKIVYYDKEIVKNYQIINEEKKL